MLIHRKVDLKFLLSHFVHKLILISFHSYQLEYFRALKDHEGNLLSHNFRPVQPIGDRIVWLTSDKFSPNEVDLHDKIHGQTTKPTKKSKKKNNGRRIVSGTVILLSMIIIDLML